VLLQLDFHRDEVVNRVQSKQVAVGATDEDVLFDALRLEVAHRYGAPHRLVLHRDYLTLLFQGVEIEYIDLLVRSIAE